MDDFRVGSVSSSDPYGNRQPSGSNARKRAKQQSGQHEDEPADTFAHDDSANEAIEDYYAPSERDRDS